MYTEQETSQVLTGPPAGISSSQVSTGPPAGTSSSQVSTGPRAENVSQDSCHAIKRTTDTSRPVYVCYYIFIIYINCNY